MKGFADEKKLVEACCANDRRAQEVLYRQYFPSMWRMAMRYTRDEDRAMEIVNNGFLRVFKKIGTFQFRGSLEGWVRRLVYHSIADYFKTHEKYLHFLVFEEHDERIEACGESQLFEHDILKAVGQLPPMSQEVFKRFAVEGYSHAEIARDLGMTEGTSKWHLSTARARLREVLQLEFSQNIEKNGTER